MHARDRRTLLVAAALLLGTTACGSGEKKAPASGADTSNAVGAAPASNANTNANACPDGNAGLTLPSGFCAGIFADSVGHARHIVVASNGDVYATLEGTAPKTTSPANEEPKPNTNASFVAMRDTTHDGKADVIHRVGTMGNTGIALANGYLYVDEGKAIVRYARADSELVPHGKREVVVDGIPMAPGHRARNIAIGGSDLYVNVGSATNSCQQKDRANESKGVDPCTELETRAGTWRFAAATLNQHFSRGARFATGIRNGMGLAVASDGKLWGTQHGRDQLHDNWPKVFPTAQYQAENPGEELIQINRNDDFGWPYCYWAVDEKKLVDAPEYGGDGKKTDRCAQKKAPVATFPGHWAPMSLFFYGGNMFPDKYRNGAFIAFHGSWNRAPEPQAGYRVVFQPLNGGNAGGDYETFADGFAGVTGQALQPDAAKHRPVGIAAGPDGALFVSDDAGGRIYRITYKK